ncbi:MAG: tRNA threonylcarbamoyladenosine dehydratase [Fusobacteriaceae bacterium]|nr:tRNA threonylcarbamoyladenosine dehydratase [Fusobacteriaceae bacterium]MBP9510234.1 tRNA threonylcarbamoyladenosine dehydratase [Fusobacteriaceae bacterium]
MMFQRVELLLGKECVEKLKNSHVIVFGLGGVGGYVVEALIRTGLGEITVVDFDTIDITNLNRQIIATQNQVGKYKAEVIKERILSINPQVKVNSYIEKFEEESADKFFNENTKYTYVVDAIDLVKHKLKIIELSKKMGFPVISCMGTGNKLNPEMLKISDISKTSVCPLARVMRKELKNRRISKVKVLYSVEIPKKPKNENGSREKKVNVGSVSFVPSAAGLIIASHVVKEICGVE